MLSKLSLLSYISLGLLAFTGGYQLASYKYSLEIKRIELTYQKSLSDSLNEQLVRERELHNDVIQTQNSFDLSRSDIANQYNSLLDVKLFDASKWLSERTFSADSKDLSCSSSHSQGAVKETQCRCNADNAGELSRIQKLYEKELKKAKECDLKTAQLNSLVDLLNSFQERL